jgi:hypothetical protein
MTHMGGVPAVFTYAIPAREIYEYASCFHRYQLREGWPSHRYAVGGACLEMIGLRNLPFGGSATSEMSENRH